MDFWTLVGQARHGDASQTPVSAGPSAGKVKFSAIWDACAKALIAKSPVPDIHILDDCRTGELPSRWPELHGWERKRKRIQAEWEAAVDRLGIPAWNMDSTFSSGGGVADTYRLDQIPMYFGSNGLLYVGTGGKTHAGTHTGGLTYHTSDAVPEVWHEKWGAWGTIDNRHEIATGFANLVVRHSLTVPL